ncbi:MAG: hypothetical protein WAZ20_02485 [Methanothrix sp.]|uniref:hypothetical protein n=3 Tax=Methanothrix sp. TaxID=90426 RepID=UPI003BB72B1C
MISDYFRAVELRMIDVEIITDKKINYSEFSPDEGILPARLLFVDGPLLEFMEYLHKEQRLKYGFHLIALPLSQDHQYGMALLSIFRSSNKQINVWVKKIIRATLFSMLTFVY